MRIFGGLFSDLTDRAARIVGRVDLNASEISGGVESIAAGLQLALVTRIEWMSHVVNGRAYTQIATQAAVAGVFSQVMLRNPAASGKSLLVRAAQSDFAAAGRVELIDAADPVVAGNAGRNLIRGGPASVGIVSIRTVAASPGEGWRNNGAANTLLHFVAGADWMFDLPAGGALLMTGTVVNTALAGAFQWAEV